jgi:hypothetical protein
LKPERWGHRWFKRSARERCSVTRDDDGGGGGGDIIINNIIIIIIIIIIIGTSHRKDDFIHENVTFLMTTCFHHISVILRPTVSIQAW